MQAEEQFLKIDFQKKLEEAEYYSNLPSEEEKPYDNKYKSRDVLKSLLSHTYLLNPQSSKGPICNAIVKMKLGANYSDTEENSAAEKCYRESLAIFQSMSYDDLRPYFNMLQEIYNIYGFLSINRDENEMGLSFLGKSKDLYTNLLELPECNPEADPDASRELVSLQIDLKDPTKQRFQFAYLGGVCRVKTESLYTHTLFYLAQAYTKLGNRSLAAQYCGETMKRQHATKTYELKDFCVNCISLSDYYSGIGNFAQAQYLLLVAEQTIPEGTKKKLRASCQMSLGHMMLQYMTYNVSALIADNKEQEIQNFENIINTNSLMFECSIGFPNLKVAKDIEEVKSIFRQANTQMKRAQEYFKLDGYVTEHIQIVEDQSTLYKQLILLEQSNPVVLAMLEKRAQLIEPIYNELNPKAYMDTWQKLLVQLSEIYHDLFNLNFHEMFGGANKKAPKPSKFRELNMQGLKCISFFEQISQILQEDKDTPRDNSFFHSVVNAKFNCAKIYSKLQGVDKQQCIGYLTKSLEGYRGISAYIRTEVAKNGALDDTFSQELKMCNEMADLLPAKIDKIARS